MMAMISKYCAKSHPQRDYQTFCAEKKKIGDFEQTFSAQGCWLYSFEFDDVVDGDDDHQDNNKDDMDFGHVSNKH